MIGTRIVAVAGDPGGAAAIAPVIEALRRAGRLVIALAYRQAAQVWKGQGLAFDDVPETTDVKEARRILRSSPTAGLLTATSVNGVDLEKHFIAAARHDRVPSVAVLDFWSSYRRASRTTPANSLFCRTRLP